MFGRYRRLVPWAQRDLIKRHGLPTVYVAGPMNGLPQHNFPAFHTEAGRLRALGYRVLSPAEKAGEQAAIEAAEHGPEFRETQTYKDFLKADLRMVLDSDAIQLLPGWENSRGAQLEVHVARAVGIEVWEPQGERVMVA